jgi:hypothetical protein
MPALNKKWSHAFWGLPYSKMPESEAVLINVGKTPPIRYKVDHPVRIWLKQTVLDANACGCAQGLPDPVATKLDFNTSVIALA